MRKILFVIPSLEYSGAARLVCLLARGLPREHFAAHVCALGGAAPWAGALRRDGISVEELGWNRPFDLLPFLRLRRRVRELAPDVVHAWGLPALRALALSGARSPGRLFVSRALPPGRGAGLGDRWLLRQAGRVVAFGADELARYRAQGVAQARLTLLPHGVEPHPSCAPATGVPDNARVILGVGPLEPHKGFHEAVWTLDILNAVYGTLEFVLAGTGSERPRVEGFARLSGVAGQARFLGPAADLAPWRERAEVVWVPSLRPGGVGAALEGMAAGRPVVAAALPTLAEVVAEGETGLLAPPGDKAQLARRTRLLLEDPELRRRFGEAGRRRVEERFSARGLVEEAGRLYAGENC